MIKILSYATLIIYSISILMIFLYSLSQFNLLKSYLRSKKNPILRKKFNFLNQDEIPIVTIQLPIYNEKYVVERLLDNIVLLDYPKNKLEIQVLDDSTDDSVLETAEIIKKYFEAGFDIVHIRRQNRTGFKAGALKEGLVTAKGEFIAIFDADFLPSSSWLNQTIPYFIDSKIGVVQTRWSHINRNYSILTKIQAFALDAHFTLEQTGRNFQNYCIIFNGTAGVWRKSCIIDAGNWESDTLTEDLDLSYRAQLKNWKFIYLEDVETPAEIPAHLSAAQSQQFRWNKGGAENLVKIASRLLKSDKISYKTKFHGILHLLNSSMFLLVFTMAIFSVPTLFIKSHFIDLKLYFNVMIFFFLTTLIFFTCYWFTYKNIQGGGINGFFKFVKLFFTFYTIAMGFSFQNSVAVLEGLFGKKSEFVRTPKFNIETLKDKWKENVYITSKVSKNTIVEGFLILYFIFALFYGYILKDFALFPFHIMLVIGYSYVFIQSLKAN